MNVQIYLTHCISLVFFAATFRSLLPGLPDPTIFLILSSCLLLIMAPNYKPNYKLAVAIIFLAIQLLTILYNNDSLQTVEKFLRLSFITFPLIIISGYININTRTIDTFEKDLLLLGVVVLFVFSINFFGNTQAARGGAAAPILVSRSLLLFSLMALYSMLNKKRYKLLYFFLFVSGVYAAILTESRGPLGAFLISAIIMVTLKRVSIISRILLLIITPLIILGLTSSSESLSRLTDIFNGKFDTSITTRLEAWWVAFAGFIDRPFGHGLGNFINEGIYGTVNGVSEVLKYPHNFILEAAYESGVFFLLFIIVIFMVSIKNIFASPTLKDSWIPSVFIFTIFNSLFSSDVPGNKEMWIMLILCLPSLHFSKRKEFSSL